MTRPGTGNSGHRLLDDWLRWLETLSPTEIDLGLDRVQQVLDRLQANRPRRVIHIGGTNGKGSCAAMLEAVFMHVGERVGVYTSPHLSRYNERIRIDAEPVNDAQIISAFERVEAARRDVPLTYFEFGTLAAIVIFEAYDTDTVILEVGMGGRLDAVNAIEPDAGIITNVSLDHCDWLGADVESIAAEKAGIMRGGKPFVFGAACVPAAILTTAEKLGTDLYRPGTDYAWELNSTDTWSWTGRRQKLATLAMPGLAGRFQLQNAAAVLALLEAMRLDDLLDKKLIDDALGRVELAGRCQLIRSDRNWLLDVAHNADAAQVLGEFMAESPSAGSTVAIIGMLGDKDREGIVSHIREYVDAWISVTAASRRAVPARTLAAAIANLCNKPCLIAESLPHAMQFAHDQTTAEDRILVSGSFYVVGPALEWLGAETSM